MTRRQTNIGLSDDKRIKLDQIVSTKPNGTTMVQVIGDLIDTAYDQLKQIIARKNGNRILGLDYYYGSHHVCYVDGVTSKPEAEKALDAFVFEELSK